MAYKQIQILLYIIVLIALSKQEISKELPTSDEIVNYEQSAQRNVDRDITKSEGIDRKPLILTKYIEEGKLKEAREAARVNSDYPIPGVDSYAGYFTVNKEYNSNLFFWYFPVLKQPVEDTPWLIWLQGGPGDSSTFGLFTEIGPFSFQNGKLKENMYSWGKNHSLVFIDSPVGTGFSFTDDERGYATNQTTIGESLYIALQQFLTVFPELRKAPLTITGESYAGKHIPSLGVQIHWHRDKDPPINLTHLAIGNGFIDPLTLQRYSYFVREIGIVDDHIADIIKQYEDMIVKCIAEHDMKHAHLFYKQLVEIIKFYSKVNVYNYLKEPQNLDRIDFVKFLSDWRVQAAIHVGIMPFRRHNYTVLEYLIHDFMNSAKPWLEELIQNYKVMCYNGQLDVIVAYHLSVNTHNSLKFPGSDKWKSTRRSKWSHGRRLAGYYKTVGNFTEVMVRGAGHMVPTDQPSAALGMLTAFVRDLGFGNDTGYLVDN